LKHCTREDSGLTPHCASAAGRGKLRHEAQERRPGRRTPNHVTSIMTQTHTPSFASFLSRCAVPALLCAGVLATPAWAHGNVTPQAVDTSELPKLGDEWKKENPFRGNATAIKIGASAYNQNCARCHGLEAVSGGIAPDLRKLDNDCSIQKVAAKKAACVAEMDEYYSGSVRRGKVRNGAVYMPPFEDIMNQEAIWSIKAYLESRREKPL
jgi:cytochrome c-550 PedF